MIKYLVTGIGRSGTVYMARLLTSLGIMCGHESIFDKDGIDFSLIRLQNKKERILSDTSRVAIRDINNKIIYEKEIWFNVKDQIAESSYMSAPFLDNEKLKDCKVIHVVRNPLKVISSTYFDVNFFEEPLQKGYVKFVLEHVPEIKEIDNNLEKTVAYYIAWNRMIENKLKNKEHLFVNVERMPSEKLFNFLEIPYTNKYFKDRTINHWNKRDKDLTLDDIPEGKIKNDLIQIIEDYNYQKKEMTLI